MGNMSYIKLGMAALGAAAVYGASRGKGRRVGRRYDATEWVAFFSADHPTAEGIRLGNKFRDRIEYLVDNKFNLPDDAEYPDLDSLAYLSYASHAGHGIGLWEADEPWHPAFEKVVMSDKQARDLGYRLDEEVWEGQVAAGEANRGRRGVKAGQKFVIVDVSVPGGRWVDNRIYDSARAADRAASKMKGRVRVIDAVWYAPSETRLRKTGMRNKAANWKRQPDGSYLWSRGPAEGGSMLIKKERILLPATGRQVGRWVIYQNYPTGRYSGWNQRGMYYRSLRDAKIGAERIALGVY